MRSPSAAQRGAALLTAVFMVLILMTLVYGLFTFVGPERIRAGRTAREVARVSCAGAGLQLARSYFARNNASWNGFLADPGHYNPVYASWNTTAADPVSGSTSWGKTAPYTNLFYDLDGDGKSDVYIYIRDNQDELFPAANNWTRDNDQNVIVGAICISSTMNPRLPNGQVDLAQLTVESLISYNTPSNPYTGQSNGGASGTGNVN